MIVFNEATDKKVRYLSYNPHGLAEGLPRTLYESHGLLEGPPRTVYEEIWVMELDDRDLDWAERRLTSQLDSAILASMTVSFRDDPPPTDHPMPPDQDAAEMHLLGCRVRNDQAAIKASRGE